jgi:hypothetical protein
MVVSIGLITLVGCQPKSNPKEDFGHFDGQVVASWLDDGRQMKLTEDFSYIDPQNKKWGAPKDSVVDGASIPRPFWSFIGGPFEGQYRKASVVHDVACQEKKEPWQDVHLMFYYACRCGGVSEEMAKLMYYGVYNGGPRWTRKIVEGKPVYELSAPFQEHFDENQLQKVKEYIETNNPSLEEIRNIKP